MRNRNDINERLNWRAIIERHERLDKQIRRGYVLAIVSGLFGVFALGQVIRGRWNADSILVELLILSGLAGLFIGLMLIIFGGYQVSNLPYPDEDDDDDIDYYESGGRPSPLILSPISRHQSIRPKHGLTDEEWNAMAAAVANSGWRFNRAILEQAGIQDLTTYLADGRTRYGVVRDELVRAGMVVDNRIPEDKRWLFFALPRSGSRVQPAGLPLTTTGGGGSYA